MKIGARKIRPTAKPVPFPKLFARSMATMIQMMKFTIGMKNRITFHPGRPTIFIRM